MAAEAALPQRRLPRHPLRRRLRPRRRRPRHRRRRRTRLRQRVAEPVLRALAGLRARGRLRRDAALCILIATTLGEGQAKPRLAFGLIFALLATYFVILFALQRADIGRAESGALPADLDPGEIEDPAAVPESTLWAAMAVKPIDEAATKARATMWAPARTSVRYGMLITLLIFLSVPPIYLFDTFVPLVIGAPLIVLIAIVASVRITMSGGQLEQGFARLDASMAPLGLSVTGRPKVELRTRAPAQPGFSAGLDGPVGACGRASRTCGDDHPAAAERREAEEPDGTRHPRARVFAEGPFSGCTRTRERRRRSRPPWSSWHRRRAGPA